MTAPAYRRDTQASRHNSIPFPTLASMVTTHDSQRSSPPRLAVIGGGPVGLSLALLARQRCPAWSISVFDARDAAKDITGDPRTLALSLGSVPMLERLRAWPAAKAQG